MVTSSLLELAKTREFGDLKHGLHRDVVRALLGSPPLWGTESNEASSTIWRYGDIELYFKHHFLEFIFTDHENLNDGGPTLLLDSWVVRRGLPLEDFENELHRNEIGFSISRWQYDQSQCHLLTEAGVSFSFVDQPEDDSDEIGLVWWSTSKRETKT